MYKPIAHKESTSFVGPVAQKLPPGPNTAAPSFFRAPRKLVPTPDGQSVISPEASKASPVVDAISPQA